MTAAHRKPLESDDPFELVGIRFPIRSVVDADREFAACLVEEFALAGFSAMEVARLFESASYVAPHGVLTRRGAEFVRSIIEGVYGNRS